MTAIRQLPVASAGHGRPRRSTRDVEPTLSGETGRGGPASWSRTYREVVDAPEPIPFPRAFEPTAEELERALAEIDAAIELVARGGAVRITLTGFPIADAVAGVGSARAQAAYVGFRLEQHAATSGRSIVIGPVLTASTIRASR